jgi:hypothetical protein
MEAVSTQIVSLLGRLEPAQDTGTTLARLVENELRHRLNRYQFTDRTLTRKYQMPFADFQARRVVEQHDHSFEVEADLWDWEMALDGMETVQTLLAELEASRRANP